MTIGGSIFLIAVGAILRYALDVSVRGVDLDVVGLILMIAGAAGLTLGLFFYLNTERQRDRERARYDERRPDPAYDERRPGPPPPP